MKKFNQDFWKRTAYFVGAIIILLLLLRMIPGLTEQIENYSEVAYVSLTRVIYSMLFTVFLLFTSVLLIIGGIKNRMPFKRGYFLILACVILLWGLSNYIDHYNYIKWKAQWFSGINYKDKGIFQPYTANNPTNKVDMYPTLRQQLGDPLPAEKIGLKDGDTVLTLFGLEHKPENYEKIEQLYQNWLRSFNEWSYPEPIPMTIERDGSILEIDYLIHVPFFFPMLYQDETPTFWTICIVLGVIYLCLGLFVILKNSMEECTILFSLYSFSMAFLFLSLWGFWYNLLNLIFRSIWFISLPFALFLHFLLIFPEKKYFIKKRPYILFLIYLLPVVLIFTANFQTFGEIIGAVDQSFKISYREVLVILIILFFFVPAGIMNFIFSYRKTPKPEARNQLKWILWGVLMPFVVFFLSMVANLFIKGFFEKEIFENTLSYIFTPSLILIPISFAFSIFKYGLMGIDTVINKSIVYSITIFILMLALEALSNTTSAALLQITGQTSSLATVFSAVVVTSLFSPVSKKVESYVDRKIFSDKYNYQIALTKFGEDIQQLKEVPKINRLLVEHTTDDFGVSSASLFLLDKQRGAYTAYNHKGLPERSVEETEFSPGEELITRLKEWQKPVSLQMDSDIDPRFRKLDARVCVPIFANSKLIGLLNLGSKLSKNMYSNQDLELLAKLAQQASEAFENAMLKDQLTEEVEEKHEFELASKLQQEMLPTHIPQRKELDIDAYTRSSKQIGGDFYDFIEGETKLGIIIGDVSAKSVSSAVLMGVIQGIAETVSGFKSSGEVLQDVNRALVKRFGKGKTVSLAYADFVLSGKKVIYSSAAMPSPVLVRNGVPQFWEAVEMAQPLGKRLTAQFPEKTIDLQFGDTLIFISDGITIAQNTNRESYGNQRLLSALTGVNGGLTAREIRDLIFADVLSFVGNAEQKDDMTAVVVKVK